MNEDRASRYHRLKRQASVASLCWTLALFTILLVTGGSLAIRSAAGHGPLATVAYVLVVLVLNELGGLPLSFYSGLVLERRYGLSRERLGTWLVDQLKSFLIGFVLSSVAALVVYAFIRTSPDRWWLPAGAAFALLVIGLTNLAPVVLLPLFYRVKPLERATLRERLLGLAERAGARVVGAYEWGLSEKTRKANAALAGLGATRRILVSDTMLAEYSDDEIEVVLAHELAHHVHGDIWKGIALEVVLILAGFYVAARLLAAFAPAFGLDGVGDIAGLPLLVLAAGAVSLVMVPFAHAMSRAFERSADRFALRLTRNPTAFVSAMRRLAAQNLAEEHPSRLVQLLFYSHPPVRERIAAAQAFKS